MSYYQMTIQSCSDLLMNVKAICECVGSLVVLGIINDSKEAPNWRVPSKSHYQVSNLNKASSTCWLSTHWGLCLYQTTNLVIFAPQGAPKESRGSNIVANGDALIVDPGCLYKHHGEHYHLCIVQWISSRKLLPPCPGSLSVIPKCNPDAILLVLENTMRHTGKDDRSLGYTSASGDEEICISGQWLNVISVLGHTDGYMALLHVSSCSLIVGDHCGVKEVPSWILNYIILYVGILQNNLHIFGTCPTFTDPPARKGQPVAKAHALWVSQNIITSHCILLFRNRRNRESTILKATESGAETLFDIVAYTYADVDKKLWIPAASNVKLHVDHLAQQDKLTRSCEFLLHQMSNFMWIIWPSKISYRSKFQETCERHFISCLAWAYPSIRLTA
ncbi:LACTB2, winged helix domain, partial [Dillenia turbinata]